MDGMLAHETAANIDWQLERLNLLVGTFEGQGKGTFPTIDPFSYQEQFSVRHLEGAPYLTYEQRTWLIDAAGCRLEVSHWEAGVIRPREDGVIVLSSAHDSARVEVLEGQIDATASVGEALSIKFESILHGNDPRMANATREWFLNGNELRYSMSMATQKTPKLTQHLVATLTRSKDCNISMQ